MRPIKLEIEGLNSFSARQVIDFEAVLREGIFGIFGNTGSGKSTTAFFELQLTNSSLLFFFCVRP